MCNTIVTIGDKEMTTEEAIKEYEKLVDEYNSIEDHDNEFDIPMRKRIHELHVIIVTGDYPEDEPECTEVTNLYCRGL